MGLRELVSDNRSLSPLEEPAGMSCPLISRSFWFWGSEGPKVDATQLSARKDLSLFLRRGQLLHGAKTQEDEGSGGKGRRDGKIEGICIGDCDSLPPPTHTHWSSRKTGAWITESLGEGNQTCWGVREDHTAPSTEGGSRRSGAAIFAEQCGNR